MRFFSQGEAQKIGKKPKPKHWTAVIPAAGRGSRLGYSKPKILFPIAGRTILDWLVDLLEPKCRELVFILSPDGSQEIEPLLVQRLSSRYRIAIQDEPKGMAHAIYQAVPGITTNHALIIWGDQVALQPKTVDGIMRLHQASAKPGLTLPIVRRQEPYVHYQTNRAGQFVRVLERREGARMPKTGQSDCGVFAVSSPRLKKLFEDEVAQGIKYSQGTSEWNFLPMLPGFEKDTDVNALRLDSLEETVGVNDTADATFLESYLRGQST